MSKVILDVYWAPMCSTTNKELLLSWPPEERRFEMHLCKLIGQAAELDIVNEQTSGEDIVAHTDSWITYCVLTAVTPSQQYATAVIGALAASTWVATPSSTLQHTMLASKPVQHMTVLM